MAKSKTEASWQDTIRSACRSWSGSVRSLSIASGLDYGQLHRFLSGEQSIGIDQAEKLGRVLGIKLVAPKQPRSQP
jgi:hypothetical protein